jgi:fermentation-respiration switch protein FrsA (DUF1100 family)
MALFQYFPNNYVWSLSVAIAFESGAKIGEIEDMCRPGLPEALAKRGVSTLSIDQPGTRDSLRLHKLDGQMEKIRVPFLVAHGARDRQIPLRYAQRSFDQLLNSPKRELKIFTEREGGVEHVGADNMSFGCAFIADWLSETLGGRTAYRRRIGEGCRCR